MATRPNMCRSYGFLIFGLLTLICLLSVQGHAQVAGATVTGTVTDPSGAAIANAEVSIMNTATGITVSAKTNSVGFYTIPNLIPGPYQATVRANGFQTQMRNSITLTVGEQQVLNANLSLGQTSQSVEVKGEQPNVDLASSAIAGNIDEETVVDLPLNGRDWTLLAALQPGISSLASQQYAPTGFSRANRGYGTQLSINGGRPGQNNYRTDGISANDYVNSGPGSVIGGALGVDAISEFSVLSTNYSAEYGKTSGGVINAITRSGTNSFHGDVYEFLRNSALDAATIVDNNAGRPKPPFRQNQFGAAAGGPIQKDRTFVFGDYEGIRQSLGLTTLSTVFSPAARNGTLNFASPASFPAGCVATSVANQCQVTVDSKVKPFLGLWPLPNAGLLGNGNTGTFALVDQQIANENFVTGRVDHRFSDKDSMFGSYQFDKALVSAPDKFDNVLQGNSTKRQLLALEETHVFNPDLVNNLRFGFTRTVAHAGYGISAMNPLAKDPTLSAVPGFNNPGISVAGGITAAPAGLVPEANYDYFYNSFQAYEDAFLTKGNHLLKFGGGVERMQLNTFARSGPAGSFSFASTAAFLTNQGGSGNTFSAQDQKSQESGFRQTVAGAYLQDDIRWRPSLTINLGIRYEMATVPTLVNGQISTLLNPTDAQPHCGRLVAGCAGTIDSLFGTNPTLHNFEPRVGFAWDPFHNGKTSVRGGFGFYDVLPLFYTVVSDERTTAPFWKSVTLNPLPTSGLFPTGADLAALGNPKPDTSYVQQNPKRNYVMQWNLNVQRELLPNLTVMLAYIGSRGVHMMLQSKENISLPTLTPQGYLWPCAGTFSSTGLCSKPGQEALLNPKIGDSPTVRWNTDSFYDALDLQITKKISRGVQVQGSYTWGRAIDETSSGYNGDATANGLSNSLAWLNPRLTRGPSDFNVTQILSINGIWQLPTPRSLPDAAVWLLGGWQIGGIYTIRTGTPFSVLLSGDPLGTNNSGTWEPPNYLARPGCESPVSPGNFTNYIKLQCFAFPNPSTLLGNAGRNSLYGPGMVNLDLSLFKNNYIRRISENFNVQFRAEFFNALNRPNLASPTDRNKLFDQTGAPIGGAGSLDLLATPAREIQFAVKVVW